MKPFFSPIAEQSCAANFSIIYTQGEFTGFNQLSPKSFIKWNFTPKMKKIGKRERIGVSNVSFVLMCVGFFLFCWMQSRYKPKVMPMNFHPSMMRICTEHTSWAVYTSVVQLSFMLTGSPSSDICLVTRTRNFNSFRNEPTCTVKKSHFHFCTKFVST